MRFERAERAGVAQCGVPRRRAASWNDLRQHLDGGRGSILVAIGHRNGFEAVLRHLSRYTNG